MSKPWDSRLPELLLADRKRNKFERDDIEIGKNECLQGQHLPDLPLAVASRNKIF
jgi:hypothetical protein